MGEAAIALSTKIHLVQISVDRLERDIKDLDAALSTKTGQIDKCIARKPRPALVLPDEAVAYRLVASLDAFLYEARSTYEMLRAFVLNFTRHILKQRCGEREAERTLKEAMIAGAHSFEWAEVLRGERATFFHGTAPWIAMEITTRQPRHYELLILKETVADLEKNPKYTKFQEYRRIWVGLKHCQADVERWAVAKLDELR
ncbi:MAG TPA: hypothetical protein VMV15_02445 [Candidatus Binataceae bacterium]|nr:hypothetical protein [Candidatus Binataceae bacterium]